MKTERIGDITMVGAEAIEPGKLYVLRGTFGSGDFAVETLHVISVYSGGECRGYQRPAGSDGPWTLRTPSYPFDWPELDAAVAALVMTAVQMPQQRQS